MINHIYFQLKNLHISRTFKYTKTFDRKLVMFFSLKILFLLSNFSCNSNDLHLKNFIDSNIDIS